MTTSNKQQQQQQTTIAIDEGNRGPTMEVCLCGGYLSFGYGGSVKEVLWWSELWREESWEMRERVRDENER